MVPVSALERFHCIIWVAIYFGITILLLSSLVSLFYQVSELGHSVSEVSDCPHCLHQLHQYASEAESDLCSCNLYHHYCYHTLV